MLNKVQDPRSYKAVMSNHPEGEIDDKTAMVESLENILISHRSITAELEEHDVLAPELIEAYNKYAKLLNEAYQEYIKI